MQAGDLLRRDKLRLGIARSVEILERQMTQPVEVAHFIETLLGVRSDLTGAAYARLEPTEFLVSHWNVHAQETDASAMRAVRFAEQGCRINPA